MQVFGAREIIDELKFFSFTPEASRFLEAYMEALKSEDNFENQFRSNMASVAAAEFALLRRILNRQFYIPRGEPVLEVDAKLAILTADTLRTRPCRTPRAVKRGRYFTGDLFMLCGEASKAWYTLNENRIDLYKTQTPEQFLGFASKLYQPSEARWEFEHLPELFEAGFDRFVTLFAFLRMAVILDLKHAETLEGVGYLRRSLGF